VNIAPGCNLYQGLPPRGPGKRTDQSQCGFSESAAGLDEVVLIGYGEVRRKDLLTGSVVKFVGRVWKPSVARIDQSLAGRAFPVSKFHKLA